MIIDHRPPTTAQFIRRHSPKGFISYQPTRLLTLLLLLFKMLLSSLLLSSCFVFLARASVTVYNQLPLGAATASAAAANYTGAAAYDPTVLTAPPVPSPAPPNTFSLQLMSTPNDVQGLSIPLSGDFLGFSIEFSVISQVSKYIHTCRSCRTSVTHYLAGSVGINS
jgi:hypothetical protein